MKRLLSILYVVAITTLLVGCSKDDNNSVIITNLSGENWYNTQVWFMDGAQGELTGYTEVGTVTVGSTCVVETEMSYFYIYAKDSRGEMIMSKNIYISGGKATVTKNDLY